MYHFAGSSEIRPQCLHRSFRVVSLKFLLIKCLSRPFSNKVYSYDIAVIAIFQHGSDGH